MQSLGLVRTDKHLVALAGINSSRADQLAGSNKHLCTFRIDLKNPSKGTTSDATITSLGRSALFRPSTSSSEDTYQRLLRLSPASDRRRRLCAIATRGARTEELIIFNPVKTPPADSDVITRIGLPSEAAGLDITVTPEGAHSICWCTDSQVFEQSITLPSGSRKTPELTPRNPRNIFTAPTDNPQTSKTRPKYRSLRYLTSHHILLLTNLPGQTGAQLSICHVYPTGPATQVFRKTLPSRVKLAMLMDVCALEADEQANQQFIIAVAAQDNTIYTYTTDYHRATDTFGPLSTLSILKQAHSLQMTALAFEQFLASSEQKKSSGAVVRLVTADVGHTVVVHTWPAFNNHNGNDSTRRHVVASTKSAPKLLDLIRWSSLSLLFLLIAIGLQLFHAPQTMPALASLIVPGYSAARDSPADALVSEAAKTTHRLRDTLASFQSRLSGDALYTEGLVLHPVETGVSAQVIQDKAAYVRDSTSQATEHVKSVAKHWEELTDEERDKWRHALKHAGEWAVEEGEALFKGVLFGSYKDFVGAVAAEALSG